MMLRFGFVCCFLGLCFFEGANGAGLAASSSTDAEHVRHYIQKTDGRDAKKKLEVWVDALLTAVRMMKEDTAPDWREDSVRCASAVNRTLQRLDDEYLHPNVGFVLETSCDHFNVYRDFGGSKATCLPLFVDLGMDFKHDQKYETWCQEASSLLGLSKAPAPAAGAPGGAPGAAGASASPGSSPAVAAVADADPPSGAPAAVQADADATAKRKREKIAEAKKELKIAKEKKARGEDFSGDLKKLNSLMDDAEDDVDDARAAKKKGDGDDEDGEEKGEKEKSDKDSAAGDKAAKKPKGEQGGDVKVGQARWGGAQDEGAIGQKVNPAMPFAHPRAPFGQEVHASRLTKGSIAESNAMVDQVEKAQVAEEKRATYRALTHLRGMTTSSFDGIANKHMQNIAEYNAEHSWRQLHPVQHLAEEEDDVEHWAYPDAQ